MVANPGGGREMIESAIALAGCDCLASYCAPAVVSESQLARFERRLPAPLARRVVGQLRLRATPSSVPVDRLVRAGTATEVAYVLSLRMGLPRRVSDLADHCQLLAFDRASARVVHPGLDAVIGFKGTCARTFAEAQKHGVPRVLNYPLAHYDVSEGVLREERKRVPGYAATMQDDDYERWRKRRFAEEIAGADRIMMLSSYHQRTFEAAGIDSAQLFMATPGVDLELFTPGRSGREGPFRVLFCGQITQRKGISYLVEAFRKAELERAELVFAGRPVGTRHPWIDEPRVRHIRPVARPRLVDIYRRADVIVLPSLIESFGLTAIEGMACGLPAIVSEHTFAHDVIEHGIDGWVTPIRDPDAIAGHLRTLYEDPHLRRMMGDAARRKAEQFPWPRYGKALRSGLAPLLGRAGVLDGL
jgi:glycosyltransferase involved in cell wall biosynthesis